MRTLLRLPFIRTSRGLTSIRSASNTTSKVEMNDNGESSSRGRGQRGSGRPWRRGNGNWRKNGPNPQNDSNSVDKPLKMNEPRPKLTHFISIPLGHLPSIRSTAESFGSALLGHTPPITGLDSSIIVSPRRLHLTLGVMSLEEEISGAQYFSNKGSQSLKTVPSALDLLRSLRPGVLNALAGHPLRIPLTAIDIMKPERNDDTRAHVLFAEPSEEDLRSADGQRLKCVCELINSGFMKAGLVVNEKRPLKLHCTLVNTSHRKPRSNGPRIPFSFAEIRNCPVVRSLAPAGRPITAALDDQQPETEAMKVVRKAEAVTNSESPSSVTTSVVSERATTVKNFAVRVDFGTHTVSEIQICRMGSWGPEGEYVCVGKIDL